MEDIKTYVFVYELKDETKTFSFKIGNPIDGVMVCLFPSSAVNQSFEPSSCQSKNYTIGSYIVTVSFIGGGNRKTRRKPPICRNSLTNFIT